MAGTPEADADYSTLAEQLSAIAYPARLAILDRLRVPHALPDILVTPHRRLPGENPGRPVSKQAVHAHLDRLVKTGLVEAEKVTLDGRRVARYTVNLQRFWSVTESLRRIGTRFAGHGSVGDETGTIVSPAVQSHPKGPRVVLVHGAYEGRVWPLRFGSGPWVIGRSRKSAMCLDYDSFVSMDHATLAADGQHFWIEDMSKNGTSVNWEPLPRGAKRELTSGDIVGVGHSMLVFRAQ